MDEQKVAVERRGHVLAIGFDRASKHNAFDVDMYRRLAAAYGELDRDTALRCGVLYANGASFTAGIDLAQWAPIFATGRMPALADGELDPFGFDDARRLSKPMVVATQGLCLTVGLELMLAADVRVAADDSRFGQIEVKRGIYPAAGATIRMVQELGWGNAQRYLLTGDEFGAAEAHRIGLVQEVVPVGLQLERATALAERIAKQAPLGVVASLRSSRLSLQQGARAAMSRLLEDLMPLMQSDDAREGLRSFLERRDADFQGR